ncbi:MAG: major capsid protein [Gammaproteobacteria bacterium]|nr:major capsid protein [Gammaproteobacteria bacterium]
MSYDTATLLRVVAGLPRFDPLFLNRFFPGVALFDTDTVNFDKLGIDQATKLAPFVSPLVAGQVRTDQGGELRSFRPAYLKPKHVVDPQRMLVRRPGEALGGAMTPAMRRDAVIADNLRLQRDQIMRRLEWMAAAALRTGKVIVAGEDYPTTEVDFRRTSALTKTISVANDKWSATTSNPPDAIEEWDTELEAPSTDIIMNRVAWKHFRKHAAVQALLDTRRGSESTIETAPGNGEVVQYKGMLGAKAVWVYTGTYTDDTGTTKEYLESGEIILASAALEGIRAFGAILDPAAGYQALEMFPKNWISEDPAAEFVMTQSAPLPIPKRPNASMCVKVTDAT